MKMRRAKGMTLMEVLIALSVMTILFGVAYDTIIQSLRCHERLDKDEQRLADSCQLAEQLTGDFALLNQLTNTAPSVFLLKLRDNTTIEYQVGTNEIIRLNTFNGQRLERQYHPGKTALTFWNANTRSWIPQFEGPSPATVRLQFVDSELILSQERR